jgi:hypothetical protein
VFISSSSAISDISYYGRGKSEVEKYNTNGLNLRLGKLVSNASNDKQRKLVDFIPIPIPSKTKISVVETEKAVVALFDVIINNKESSKIVIEGKSMLLSEYYVRFVGHKTFVIPYTLFDLVFRLITCIPAGKVRAISDKWKSLKNAS